MHDRVRRETPAPQSPARTLTAPGPHPTLRPHPGDDNLGDNCPRCGCDDRILYDDEYDYWICTRCGTHWRVEPNDPRRPSTGDGQ